MSGCSFRRGRRSPVASLTLARGYLGLLGDVYQDLAQKDPWKPTVWDVLYEGRVPVYESAVSYDTAATEGLNGGFSVLLSYAHFPYEYCKSRQKYVTVSYICGPAPVVTE